jgi:hypothetical protein
MGHDRQSHGQTDTPLYTAWCGMRQRCTPMLAKRYPTYAGVHCDPLWTTFEGFRDHQPAGRSFEPGLALARFGDAGDYTPTNCRWVTRSENTREVNERFMLRLPDGRFAGDVARECGVNQKTWRTRLYRGWPIEDAVSTPAGHQRPCP